MNAQFIRLLSATLIALLTIGAAAQDYPHAFPRPGAMQLFDNERVTAWRVEWLRDIPQPIHRHRYDMAGVYLRYGPIRVTRPDGTESPQRPPFDVPRPYFQEKGVTHREEMMGYSADVPQRLAIMFDLKEAKVTPFNAPPGMPTAFPREGAIKAIDNDRVIEWDYTWTAGRSVPTHVYDKDTVQVFFVGGTIRFIAQNGSAESKTFKFGDARFIPRGTIYAEQVVDGSPRVVTIELK